MVLYKFNEEQIKKAKLFIKKLKVKRKMWEKERDKADRDRKRFPKKYYHNITERMKDAEKEIRHINKKIKELEQVVKYGEFEF